VCGVEEREGEERGRRVDRQGRGVERRENSNRMEGREGKGGIQY
jgi:hypothetical protein